MGKIELTTSDALGLAINVILMVLGIILRLIIYLKQLQKTWPRYNLVKIALFKNLLGVVISTQLCSVVYLAVVIAAVPQQPIPGESDSSSSGVDPVGYPTLVPAMVFNVGFGNWVVLLFNVFFIIISSLAIVTTFRQNYLARKEWAPFIPNHTAILHHIQGPQDRVDMCVVSPWNGFWASFVARQIGKVGLMTCVDPMVEICTRDAKPNIIAEGTQERLEFVRADPTSIPRSNSSYDCVLTVHTDRIVERKSQQDLVFDEMTRVLKLGGCFMVICNKSSMEKHLYRMGSRGITDIRTYHYGMMFMPSVLLIGNKTVSVVLPAASPNVDMSNFTRQENSHLLHSDAKMYSPNDRNGLLVGSSYESTSGDRHIFLRVMLSAPYFALLFLLNFLTFYYWPQIDKPQEFDYRYRFSSSCALGFVLFSGLMLLSAWDQSTDYVVEYPNATPGEVSAAYLKAATISFIGSVLFNGVLYLPTYLINLIGYDNNWHQSSISTANSIVVVVCGIAPSYFYFKYRQHKQKQIENS